MAKMNFWVACGYSILIFWIPLANIQKSHAQTTGGKGNIIQSRAYPQDYFRNPLNIPPQASGTFGELRSTHFHAGDDYRTQQRVGLPLFAVADGFISRVRVQMGGGGNSVYIQHPNGFTSVYLHMENFSPELARYVKSKQYEAKRFDVDLTLQPEQFPLKKSDRIGHAGNTGSSQGPHLHFEIRDTETQHPINTQLFGLHFPDKVAPLIQGLILYDLQEEPFDEETPRRILQVKNTGPGQYVLVNPITIPVNGRFGMGIQSVDRHTGTTFSNGVYSIELLVDQEPVSTVLFEKLDFESGHAIHSYIDYPHFRKTQIKYQKSFKDPNNPSPVYYKLKGDGSIQLLSGQIAQLTYRVSDIHGNTSTISLKVKQDDTYKPVAKTTPGTKMLRYSQENIFESENVAIRFPEGALYDDLYFRYYQSSKPEGGYSHMQNVHHDGIPLYKSYELSIRADQLPEHLHSKALILNSRKNSLGGTYENGFVKTHTRSFGSFYVSVDTIAPKIEPVNISDGKNMSQITQARFRISDERSGIQSFEGSIDGQWVLMEYDPKTRSLWHTFENSLSKGPHVFVLQVKDGKNNITRYEAKFTR